VVHITGGGFPENIPRIVPKGKDLDFRIRTDAWEVPPLFRWLQQARPTSGRRDVAALWPWTGRQWE